MLRLKSKAPHYLVFHITYIFNVLSNVPDVIFPNNTLPAFIPSNFRAYISAQAEEPPICIFCSSPVDPSYRKRRAMPEESSLADAGA